jgi:VWFA-related protein
MLATPRPLKLLPAFCLLVTASFLQAQSPAPASPQPPAPVATIKADARLVVLDVVVTDKNQKPIHNLKPSDFTVLEANAPQTIKNFEEHSTLSRADMARLPPMPKLPPGLFTNYSPTPPGALNILLLDALNTPMKNQMFVRDQLLQYAKNAPRGVPIAIFGLNEQLVMPQGFSTDPDVLKSVVEHNVLPGVSRKLDDPLTGEGTPNSVADALSTMGADDIGVLLSNIQNFEAVQRSVDIQQRTSQTLDAMSAIAHYLSAFPGRKNLIWFSASFPLSILPDGSGINHPFDVVIDSEDEFRETATLLANSRVAVYPIDARGLINPTGQSAANDGAKYATNFGVIAQQNKAATQNFAEHGTMDQMAETTGGRAFLDTNGLSEAVTRAVDQGSNYYTITYSPPIPKATDPSAKSSSSSSSRVSTSTTAAATTRTKQSPPPILPQQPTRSRPWTWPWSTELPTLQKLWSRRAFSPPQFRRRTRWHPATRPTPSSKSPRKAPIAAASSTSQPIPTTYLWHANKTASSPVTSRS